MSANAQNLVAPNIRRLALRTPTLPPATHTNAYLIGAKQALLVEPASPYEDEIERAVAWVQGARVEGLEVLAIVATHHHVDHIGGATALAARLALPLWAHRETIERLRGYVEFDRALFDDEELVLAGEPSVRLRVVHTPGHAPGHICLLDEDSRAMIAGDMIASIGTIIVEPTDGDMGLYIESLEHMRALAPSVLLPAHGEPILAAHEKLTQYIAHRLMREEKVFAALREVGSTSNAAELVPRAYDDAPPAVWPLATLATEAHLQKLVKDGRARYVNAKWSVSE
ncbi:MAG: MBL fold metallo-hydrolase [Sandaracinaceae bacterium]|nr:MBL fold metallo-hydrolase [Sandaracinaceae bacterium]